MRTTMEKLTIRAKPENRRNGEPGILTIRKARMKREVMKYCHEKDTGFYVRRAAS